MTVEWSADVAAADWIGPRLMPFAEGVGSVVPTGFAAYGRLFHPVDDQSGAPLRDRLLEDLALPRHLHGRTLKVVGRAASASPATGSAKRSSQELQAILESSLG